MISYVAQVINLFATTVQSVLLLASFIGQVIVTVGTRILYIVFNTVESIILLFQIIYEDNLSIITDDLPHFTNSIIDTICGQLSSLQNAVAVVCLDINYKFSAITGSIKWFSGAVVIVICEVVSLIKNAVILVGNTLWFILTFIPVQLPQILRVVFKTLSNFIVTCVVDAYMALLRVTNFLTDVPLESFIGITSAIIIVRLCIHFRETIVSLANEYYWSLVRIMWYYYYAIYNYFIDPEIREITRMSGQEVGTREISENSAVVDDGSAADALCVICQERQKCVLTLPCRHVCLCTECCMRLYGYQRTCPICRTFIYHSVTVYL